MKSSEYLPNRAGNVKEAESLENLRGFAAEKTNGGGGGRGRGGRTRVLIPAGGSFEPVQRAKLFFLSKSGRASSGRHRNLVLMVHVVASRGFKPSPSRLTRQPPPLGAAFEPADKVRAHKPVKCEFKMLPGDVHSAEYPLVPNTLLGRATLFEFRGKLKESFRALRRAAGNVREMRKSGGQERVAPLSAGHRPKSRTFPVSGFSPFFSNFHISRPSLSLSLFLSRRSRFRMFLRTRERIVFPLGNRLLVF